MSFKMILINRTNTQTKKYQKNCFLYVKLNDQHHRQQIIKANKRKYSLRTLTFNLFKNKSFN
jgi:hypothetical protein